MVEITFDRGLTKKVKGGKPALYFHEIAQELKLHMDPDGRAGEFVKRLVRDSIRDPMNDEEQEADWLHEYNPMEKILKLKAIKDEKKAAEQKKLAEKEAVIAEAAAREEEKKKAEEQSE